MAQMLSRAMGILAGTVAFLGGVLTFLATVSPTDAESNISAWLEYVGVTEFPNLLSAEWVDTASVAIGVSAAVVGIAGVCFVRRRRLQNDPRVDEKSELPSVDESKSPSQTLRFGKGEDVDLQTLIQLFDFKDRVAIASELVQPSKLVRSSYATFVTTQDLNARVAHNIIIIPAGASAENVALHICRNMDSLRDMQTSTAQIERKYGEQRKIVGERLPHSDKIYIYHEPPLDEAARERIWNAFRDREFVVEFRGPDHIAKLWETHGPRRD